MESATLLSGQGGRAARGESVVGNVRARGHGQDGRGELFVTYGIAQSLDETLIEEGVCSIDDNQLTVVRIYETGSLEADSRIVLPLDAVQRVHGKARQVKVAYVIVRILSNHSSLIDEVKQVVVQKAKIHDLDG